MSKTCLILVDPQVGFCSPSGSLARYYGYSELDEISKTLLDLEKSLGEFPQRHLVTSEYCKAQFTNGNRQHPLASLCVPGENSDCDLAGNLAKLHFQSHNIKHAPSALSSDKFDSEIDDDLKAGVRTFVVAGFLLEHCVRWTAQELMVKVAKFGAKVCVCSNFTASRLEKYRNGEVESTIAALNSVGIGYEVWQSITP